MARELGKGALRIHADRGGLPALTLGTRHAGLRRRRTGAPPGNDRRRSQGTKAAVLLCVIVALALGGCARDQPTEDDDGITYERNSEFQGPHLRVFLTLEDGRPVSVNTTDDAVSSRPAETHLPGHRARDWTFVKDVEEGTSVVYALTSWDD